MTVHSPFAAHVQRWRSAQVHYVDEGRGPNVVLLHGNPAWSYLYRHVIRALRPAWRCVAPDYPGFGLSQAPPGYGYTPQEHARCVLDLLLSRVSGRWLIVGHDWGGPIGLRVALQRPQRVAGLVLSNTWCWPPTPDLRLFSALAGGRWPGHALQVRCNAFARWLMPLGMASRGALTPEVRRAYRAPLGDGGRGHAAWVLARSIRTQSAWLAGIAERLGQLRDKPVTLVWGRGDPALGHARVLRRWRELVPWARVVTLAHASHYVPEDAPAALADAIAATPAWGARIDRGAAPW